MSDIKSDLDRAAREIRQQGISGWGNTCEEAALHIRELEDFARFMCKAWAEIDDWAHTRCGGDALMVYPMIQGTKNQMRLRKIGQQEYEASNIPKAVKALEPPQ